MFLPIIAIIDSNTKSYLVKFPIISNDDSMESFYFIFNIISKLIQLLKYKYEFMFKNKLNLNVSSNIKKVLSSLNRKKKYNKYFIKKLKNIMKYFILYWSSFVYSVKNLRIFYNSFLFDKSKKNNNF